MTLTPGRCVGHPAARPDQVAIRHGEHVVTHAGLDALATRIAVALSGIGVAAGDRVCVVSRSPIATLAMTVGTARIGAVTAPVNWRYSAAEVGGVVADAGARVVVADADLADRHRDALAPALVRLDATGAGAFDEWLTAVGTTGTPSPPRAAAEDPAVLVYTSGTSGEPKGVVLTEANLARKVSTAAGQWGCTSASVNLLATPLFHVGGLCWALGTLAAGATLVVPTSSAPDEVAATIDRHRVSHAFLVPKLLGDLVRFVAGGGRAGTSLDVVLCGAAPVGIELQRQATHTLGCRVLQVYGLTETTGSITQLDVRAALAGPDPEVALRSSGTPLAGVEIDIRDPVTTRALPSGAHGEIWTRSPQNCAGYWRRRDATSELIVDGWLRTGDGGFLDDAGRLHVTDRLKDMIISGGENIYSVEVERVLRELPAVRDVAVVGRPDDEWGEAVVAVVELHPGHALDLPTAADHVGRRLGRYKRPRDLVVVDALPRNAAGKIRKRDLRRRLGVPAPSDGAR
jgi:acyl-CoA synthetase (AMP-forming)/AMP-acid ligase II